MFDPDNRSFSFRLLQRNGKRTFYSDGERMDGEGNQMPADVSAPVTDQEALPDEASY